MCNIAVGAAQVPVFTQKVESTHLKMQPTIMAGTPTNVGIKNSWSLLAFARMKGKMQVGSFVNKETGDSFKSAIFTDGEGNRCFVAFSSKMGELTPSQIATEKDKLQVVQLESGNYSLCRQGENAWEDVAL